MKRKRKYRILLLAGLIIWATCIVIEFLLPQGSGQDTLMELSKNILRAFPILTMLLLCLIQPVIEEFAFRYWGKGKLYARIISTVGIGLFSILECGWLGFVLTGLTVYLMFFFKNEKFKTPVLMIFTSAVFAIMHVSGFSSFSTDMVIGISEIFGMALVMSYVVVNYGFIYSCIIHVLNNSLALIIPMVVFSCGEVKTFTHDGFSAELRPSSILDDNREYDYYKYRYSGELQKIAYNVACTEPAGEDENPDILFRYRLDNSQLWSEYHFTVTCNSTTKPLRTELLETLYECGLQSDTTYENAYVMTISDSVKLNLHWNANGENLTLHGLANRIKEIYDIPVVLACENSDIEWDIISFFRKEPKDITKLTFQTKDYKEILSIYKKKEAVFEHLEKEYGINIEKSDTLKVPVVTFKTTNIQ